MRKGKLCFIILFLVLFYWPNPAQSHTDLFPTYKIDSFTLVLERRSDLADVYYPKVNAADDAFPIVAVLQGAGVDKGFYSGFGRQLARFGFVVVIPSLQFLPENWLIKLEKRLESSNISSVSEGDESITTMISNVPLDWPTYILLSKSFRT